MIVYFIVAIISSIFLYLRDKYKEKKYKNVFLILSFIPFFGVLAFRYGIGYDYLNIYTKIFISIVNGGDPNWEPGITLICKFIIRFSQDPFYFFFITSFITAILVYKAILKNSEKPWLSLCIFVIGGLYMDAMNAVRQYIAIAIFAYSFRFIEERNFKKYLLLILVACLFHSSAIILLPVFFFCNLKLTPKKKIVVSLLIFMCLPFIDTVFIKIMSQTRYAVYISSAYGEANPTYSELITSSIMLVLASIWYKNAKDKEKYNIYYNLTFLFFIIAILSFKILLAYRLIMYFKISLIFMIPTLLENIKLKNNKIILYIFILGIISGITVIGAYKFKWYDTKYVTIFSKEDIG